MKKITMKALIFVLTVLGLWSVPERTGAMQIPRKMETCEDADEWISIFLGEDPDALSGEWEMTPQMDAAVSSLGGMKGMAASLAMLGKVKEIGSAYEGELQGYKVFYIPCVFSLASVDLVLATQDGAIAGLSTGLYSGDKGKAEKPENTENTAGFDYRDY